MNTQPSTNGDPVRRHEAWYRRLLLLYPRGFRRAQGPWMVQLFRDQCRAACREGGRWSQTVFWVRILSDLVRSAGRENLDALREVLRSEESKTRLTMDTANSPRIPRRVSWWLVPAGLIAGVVLSGWIAFHRPNQYRATSTIMFAPRIVGVGGDTPSIQEPAADSTEALLWWMTSESVLRRVEERLSDGGNQPVRARPQVEANATRAGAFLLSVVSPDFEYSREFAIAWASEFLELRRTQTLNAIQSTEALFQQRMLGLEHRLERASRQLEEFQKKNHVPGFGDPSDPAQRRLDQARLDLIATREELRKTEESTASQLAGAFPDNRWFDLQLEVKRAENRLEAAPDDPKVKAELRLRQADLRSFLDLIEETRRAKVESLNVKLVSDSRRVDQLALEVLESVQVGNELQRLQRDENGLRAQLEDLHRQLLSVGALRSPDRFEIVQLGAGDSTPVGPSRRLMILAGLGLGGFAGLLLAGLRMILGGPSDPGGPNAAAPVVTVPLTA